MPTYEYACSACGQEFETFQSMTEPPLADCPNPDCQGQGTVRRLISAGAGVIFKGTGFYQTDYKRSGNAGTASSEPKSTPPATPECSSCPAAANGATPPCQQKS